jgi:hypothetical protein
MTRDVSWDENQSTWLGIALRLYCNATGWEDAEWDFDDASSVVKIIELSANVMFVF